MHKIKIKPYLAKSNILHKYTKLIDKNRYYSNFGPLYTQSKRKIEKDKVFKKRILSNKIISFTYSLIKNFGLKKLISSIYPNYFSPYIVMNPKKKF